MVSSLLIPVRTRVWVSPGNGGTGLVDQVSTRPDLADHTTQDNADAAIHRFLT